MKDRIEKEVNKTRAILYCRSAKGDNSELQEQKVLLYEYVKENELAVVRIYMESGTMDVLTYHNLRLQAKYHEFDELLITALAVLGNSSIEITEEIRFLVASVVKVLSLKDGELNVETLPSAFRKYFRLNKNIKAKIY